MVLPLLTRATADGATFALTPTRPASAPLGVPPVARMPLRVPQPGEQYRFHVDMGACIGCKCCVVACNEQNGNPAAINWRRVGEIEGGWYPQTARAYLSMGCNHSLSEGVIGGGHVICPLHGHRFDLQNGAGGEPDECVQVHQVKDLDGEILLLVPATSQPMPTRRVKAHRANPRAEWNKRLEEDLYGKGNETKENRQCCPDAVR